MPIYQLECINCSNAKEVLLPMSSPSTYEELCPRCGCPMVRVMSSVNGWIDKRPSKNIVRLTGWRQGVWNGGLGK